MSEMLREVLEERAADVAVPLFDADELRALGARRVSRRRYATVAAGVAAVALAVALPFVLSRESRDPEPAPPVPPEAPARALAYAEGRTVHLGDAEVEVEDTPLALDVTDDGVVFVTADGRVWFTDGSAPEQIGTTRSAQRTPDPDETGAEYPARSPRGWVTTDNGGALAAWFAYPEPGRVDIVVHDTHNDREVARVPADPAPGCENCAEVLGLRGGTLLWVRESCEGVSAYGGGDQACRERLSPFAYDLETGDQVRLTPEEYVEEAMGHSRVLVRHALLTELKRGGETEQPLDPDELDNGIGSSFQTFPDGTLSQGGPGGTAMYDTTGNRRTRFEAPEAIRPWSQLFLVQWLDDDTFVLVDTGPRVERSDGALVTCSLESHVCEIAVPEGTTDDPVFPGF